MIGASMLGLGRALGETIAVYSSSGLDFVISPHIMAHGGTTVASFIAGVFGAGGKLGTSDLLMLGFVLFAFTLIVNLLASMIVNRSRSGGRAGRQLVRLVHTPSEDRPATSGDEDGRTRHDGTERRRPTGNVPARRALGPRATPVISGRQGLAVLLADRRVVVCRSCGSSSTN